MKLIIVEYIRDNGNWTFLITNNGLATHSDLYPGTNKGLKECKRDAAEIVRHLRKGNQVKVKR